MKKNIAFTVVALCATIGDVHAYELSPAQVGPVTGKFNALVQGWSVGESQQRTSEARSTYRLRRAEMRLSGDVRERVRYFVMVDPSKSIKYDFTPPNADTNPVQDFGLGTKIADIGEGALDAQVGQFKTPSDYEGLIPSANLLFPERSLSGRTYGDRRELGAMLSYRTPLWKLSSMLATGSPVTVNASTKLTDLHTRFELTPVKGLLVGTFMSLGDGFDYSKRGRLGLNVEYAYRDAVVRAEAAMGEINHVRTDGFAVEAGYFVTADIQPVARFDAFAPNRDKGIVGKAETLGVNWYVSRPNAKIQASASALQNMGGNYGTPNIATGQGNKEVTLAVQATL